MRVYARAPGIDPQHHRANRDTHFFWERKQMGGGERRDGVCIVQITWPSIKESYFGLCGFSGILLGNKKSHRIGKRRPIANGSTDELQITVVLVTPVQPHRCK